MRLNIQTLLLLEVMRPLLVAQRAISRISDNETQKIHASAIL
jgi:hypothetical protein